MKKINKCLVFLSLMWIVNNISCKKETSCEACRENNKPPIAIAGPDRIITLPTDSILLDGSSSNDPDGKISEWLWTKISGPASFNTIQPTDSTTKVKALISGTYQFELKVTDNGGLFAKDTVQIIVNDQVQPNRAPVANAGPDQTITLPTNTVNLDGSGSTDPDNNITSYTWTKISGPSSFTIANANAMQTQVTNLAQGIYQFELKVTDAGGLFSRDTMQINVNATLSPPPCDNTNRPNVSGQLVAVSTLSERPWAVASAGNKIAFIGFDSIDVFDLVLNTWSTVDLNLSQPRGSISVIGAGNKIFFAGGEDDLQLFSVVDIYDISTNTWTVSNLSRVGDALSAAVCGNKVFFTGGNQGIYVTNIVDIYDLTSNTWSAASLSAPRNFITAVSANNKVYFTGGDPWALQPISNIIDIYDNVANAWSTSTMQFPRVFHVAVAVNNILYCAGGTDNQTTTCSVETLNMITGERSLMSLFGPASSWSSSSQLNAVVKNSKIIFLRLWLTDPNRFDIYDIQTNSWSIGALPQPIPLGALAISVNNTIYIAGGSLNGVANTQVWKLEF